MTTTNERTSEFKPRLLVPVGESIIVHYSGKAPKATRREFQGQPIWEVNFWLGIVDKAYPNLIGQYHPLILRAWISPPRQIPATDTEPAKTIQASKLYKMLQTIAGQEVADKFANHDASITEAEIAAEGDASKREWLQGRFVDPEWWKSLRGFYVAIFKEPRKDKETKEVIYRDGGVFWQEVSELRPLKAARIMNEEQLQASIVWPLPTIGAGLPKTKAEPAQAAPAKPNGTASTPMVEPPKPEPLKFLRTFGTRKENTILLKGFCDKHADYTKLKEAYLALHGVKLVSELPTDEDVKHLLVLFWLEERRGHGGRMSSTINDQMRRRQKKLHEFTAEEAIFLLTEVDHIACMPEPF